MPIRLPFPQALFASVSTAALTAAMSVGLPVAITPAQACFVQKATGIDGLPDGTAVANPGGAFDCNQFIFEKTYDGVNTTFNTSTGNITLPGLVFLNQPGGAIPSIATTINGTNVFVILGTGPAAGDCTYFGTCTLPTATGGGETRYNASQNVTTPVTGPIFSPVIGGVPAGSGERRLFDTYGAGFNQQQNVVTSGGAAAPSGPISGLPTFVPYAEPNGALDDKISILVSGLPGELLGGCSAESAASCSQQIGLASQRLGQAMDPETRAAAFQYVYVTDTYYVPFYTGDGTSCEDSCWQYYEISQVSDDDGGGYRPNAGFVTDDDGASGERVAIVLGAADNYYDDIPITDDDGYRVWDDDGVPHRVWDDDGVSRPAPSEGEQLTQGIADEVERLNQRIRNESDPGKKKELEQRRAVILTAISQFGQDTLRNAVSSADASSAPVSRN